MKGILIGLGIIATIALVLQHRKLAELKAIEQSYSEEPASWEGHRRGIQKTVAEATAQVDPEMLEEVLTKLEEDIGKSQDRQLELLELMARLPESSLEIVLPKILSNTNHGQELRTQLLMVGLTSLSKKKPQSAAEFLIENVELIENQLGEFAGELCNRITPKILLEWAEKDLQAARHWTFEQYNSGRFQSGIMQSTGPDAVAALTAASTVLSPDQVDPEEIAQSGANAEGFIDHAVSMLDSAASRSTFLKTLDALPDTETRQSLMIELGSKWAESLPFSQSSELADELDPNSTLRFWIAAQSEGADLHSRFDWYMSGFPADDRLERVEPLVAHWTKSDFNATAKWLGDLSSSKERDTAIAAFVGEVVSTEPPSAVDWAQEISEPEVRATVLTQLYHTWTVTDEEAAVQYFRESNLVTPE